MHYAEIAVRRQCEPTRRSIGTKLRREWFGPDALEVQTRPAVPAVRAVATRVALQVRPGIRAD